MSFHFHSYKAASSDRSRFCCAREAGRFARRRMQKWKTAQWGKMRRILAYVVERASSCKKDGFMVFLA